MAKERKDGWWYPWIFVGGFAVIITVNGIMMYFAFTSWTGLETKEHYVKGLAYDANVEGARKQADLGWTVKLSIDSEAVDDKKRKVSFETQFLDDQGNPVAPLNARAFFVRPTSEGLDKELTAQLTAPGIVSGEVVLDLAGQWDVRIHAESQGRQYQHVQRVIIK
jgi:nitrogen fixation protein FixH